MKRLAVIPSDAIDDYFKGGYSEKWLREYYNPGRFFDEVYLLSPLEKDSPDLLGMKVFHTPVEKLRERLKDLKIDILRAYGGNWACRAACENKLPGVPVVVSVHDADPSKLYDSIKKADIVFSVSGAVSDLVKRKFRKDQRLWSLPNRVDFEIMRPRLRDRTEDLAQRFPFKYRILLVGRLVQEKNQETLIRALRFLGRDFCAVMVGKGDPTEYQDIARSAGVMNQCFFIESVSHEELARYYSWCDCMCTPSRSEGFGMVFIEALACGAVVVTSDIAPMNEFIKDSDNGLLVKDYENPQDLAEVVRKACRDDALRAHLKKNARASVEAFDRRKIDLMEAGFYQKIWKMKEEGVFKAPFWKAFLNQT